MSEMLDKIKDLLDHPDPESGDEGEKEMLPPLEEAVAKALYHLDEIKVYGTYGRAGECVREANEAYDAIKLLWEKHQEQQKIMDALQQPEQLKVGGYA
jgi:hypothetical protein